MSRLIVKNLPNKVTSDELKKIFSEKGEITDVQLKYTKDGKFRNFGFIGFRTDKQAEEAQEYFNGSCVKSMTITVETCAALGDKQKPRAWSKYAPDSTAFKKGSKDEPKPEVVKENKKKVKKEKKPEKSNKILELIEKHKDDPQFAEFIEAQSHVQGGDSIKEVLELIKKRRSSSSDDEAEENEEEKSEPIDKTENEDKLKTNPLEENDAEKVANKEISDMEYMKSLMKKKDSAGDSKKVLEEKKVRNLQLYHVRINGLTVKCKKKDIKDFFRPMVPFTIRIPRNKSKNGSFCFVGFRTEKELQKALFKNKSFLGGRQVNVTHYVDKKKEEAHEDSNSKRKTEEENIQNEESIGESGRIFVRNLPYIVNEDEITELFQKYGPIADINMPIDKVLRQPKGFATVTFVLPEHAVRAYSELDGSVFSGRMLHLLPGKSMDKPDDGDEEGLSFKEKKAKKLKASAKSSHNWNTLFLGANAIADVIADNYNTTKEQLLNDNNKNTSAAVRLALGETQLVAQTRSFLEEHGVCLDAFSQAPKKRSKTCILVKNLPAQTTGDQLKPLFSKFGELARFIMPHHGITALIEFVEPSEARNAFSKLAYSQFKNAPLYLEWAPDNAFTTPADLSVKHEISIEKNIERDTSKNSDGTQANTELTHQESKSAMDINENENENVDPEPDTTLFIRNVNFKTFEESLREHFKGCGKIYSVTIAKKKDPKNPSNMLSMGYGFIQFYTKKATEKALKTMQNSSLDGKTLELKRSERSNNDEIKTAKKPTVARSQTGSKILVRNIPFQANRNEIHEIFRAFGEIKTLRLPKKLTQGSDQHRGFCFIDFHSKADAKTAFDALSHSTHLYGRRMVLEWADQTDENEDVEALRKRTAQSFNQSAPGGKKSRKAVVDVDALVEES